ncbi:hypothetical protein [Streptomyces adustus]|uniref:hypothetical protein n=1 Tax=Streptomyces adustus TaxID=1609272 RepID=UPI003718ECCA
MTEEELRDAVTAELRLLAPALNTAVPVPDLTYAPHGRGDHRGVEDGLPPAARR